MLGLAGLLVSGFASGVTALDLSAIEQMPLPTLAEMQRQPPQCRSDFKVCWKFTPTGDRFVVKDERERFLSATNLAMTGLLGVGHYLDSQSTLPNIGKVKITQTPLGDGWMLIETRVFHERNLFVRPFVKDPALHHAIWGTFHAGVGVASWRLRRANGRTFWGKTARLIGYAVPIGLTSAHLYLWHRNSVMARGFVTPPPGQVGP